VAAPRSRATRLLARALIGGLALVALTAAPAAADPAGPSDFRSRVTGIEPAAPGVHAEIRGGDTFLEVSVDEGHEVTVDGYQGEPYLRYLEDGTVQRNTRSPATYLNNSRTAKVTVPSSADPKASPRWETVGHGGSYAWHDHRVHWMGDARPPVPRGHKVEGDYDPWNVPLVVDGTQVHVQGTLVYEPSTSVLPWIALILVAGAGLGVLGRRRAVLSAAIALTGASVLAVVVGRADFS
jgi:hypothetical protein